MEWQSMHIHPTPGERVLVVTDDSLVTIGYWHPDEGWMIEVEMGEMDDEPLYWMPLPEPPKEITNVSSTH